MPSAKIHHLTAPAKRGRPPTKPAKPPAIKREVFSFPPLLPQPAPAHMGEEAGRIYEQLTSELSKTGAHSTADLPSIEVLAEATANYRSLRKLIDTEGPLVVNNKGSRVSHPALYALTGERGTILSVSAMLMPSPRARGGALQKIVEETAEVPPEVEEPEEEEPAEEPAAKIASGEF